MFAPHSGHRRPPSRVPIDSEPRWVGVLHTLEQCRRVLPPAPARIVEMGAGDGLLAAALVARGYDVLAVDDNQEMVDATLERGVDALCTDAVRFSAVEPFDAVLFTRSLHHMTPLDAALDRAHEALRPGGVLFIEDFAWETLDREAARHAVDLFAVCEAAGLVEEPWVGELDVDGFRERWMREYGEEHALHTGETMRAAVQERFTLTEVAPVEYLYRYLCWRIMPGATGRRVAQAAYDAEARRVFEGHLRGVGLRLTARRD